MRQHVSVDASSATSAGCILSAASSGGAGGPTDAPDKTPRAPVDDPGTPPPVKGPHPGKPPLKDPRPPEPTRRDPPSPPPMPGEQPPEIHDPPPIGTPPGVRF
jgi:hypothetical protein